MQTLNVDLGARSYPIFIGEALLAQPENFLPFIKGSQVLIVTNETVAPIYLDSLKKAIPAEYQVDEVILPDGERFKNFQTLNQIFDVALQKKHSRKTTFIALGGGVVGDMAGFAAAAYQRGVNFIQVPTTLLSQVDSSVGGKTGINHPLGKNMIGAFYQPQSVVIDTRVLSSLPERELAAGIAEVIKYGCIYDYAFFCWLEKNMQNLLAKDPDALTYAIKRSCEIKAEVVAQDEKESGLRAILNFGHTFGHAIETHMGYGAWLHGEAVATGMVMAAELSVRLGWLPEDMHQRIVNLTEAANLPILAPTDMSADDFLTHMSVDKKNVDGKIRLILLKDCGHAVITDDYDSAKFSSTLNRQPI